MKITNYETKNSVATFALQGKRFCKSGGSIVSSVAFLTGMAAVVLGLMFTLSTPSFAQGTGIDETIPSNGTGNIDITNERRIQALWYGIRADHRGTTGSIGITNEVNRTVRGEQIYGISASHLGAGGIGITNKGTSRGGVDGINVEHRGTGDIVITNKNTAWGEGHIGLRAEHRGTIGNIRITNEGSSRGGWHGIDAIHYGTTGDIEVTNKGFAQGGTGRGIRVLRYGAGNIGITNEGTSRGAYGIYVHRSGTGNIVIANKNFVWGETSSGIFANRSGSVMGGIEITNEGRVRGKGSGIAAYRLGSGVGGIAITNKNAVVGETLDGIYAYRGLGTAESIGGRDIVIVNEGNIQGKRFGINAEHANYGDIEITNEGQVKGDDIAIQLEHRGTGDIGITNKHYVNESNIGMHINHTGTGDIGIANEGNIDGGAKGIHAKHGDDGDIKIANKELVWGYIGMHLEHDGDGDIEITNTNEGMIKGDENKTGDTAIQVEHTGTGDIGITNQGMVKKGDIGIDAEHTGTGDIVLKIDDGSMVIADRGYGIEATHTGTGEIEIDVSGTVSGGTNNGPISMTSSGDKTLILRPSFVLNSGQSHVDITSAGTGDGILELNQDDDPLVDGATPASASLNFGDFNFQGFNEFDKKGGNIWEIKGIASDAEKFDTATIREGTLRFTSGVTFKMSEPEAATDPKHYFKIEDGAVLEVIGQNNVLEGNLDNRGEIVFKQDAGQNVASALAVGNDSRGGAYKGGGKVFFHAGSSGWRADKLKIEGSKDSADLTEVGIKGEAPNFDSRENEFLPMVIEVEGEAAATSFSGLVNASHHKYYLDASYDFDEEENKITMHRWQFRRGEELSDVSDAGSSYEDDLTTEVDPEEITLVPNDEDEDNELGLRADVRGHEGGVWGRQQSLRTSAGPGVIASKGSRKTDERVHFGYDTPAMGFMGGDMVVRTSVSRGLSISDVFSSSGGNRINMESDAAALSALWQSPVGFYAGGGTRYVRSSSDISTEGFAIARDNEGVGVGASAKAGYRFAVPVGGMDFSVAPQVQLLWSSVDFDDFTGLTGEVVSLEDGELVTGRLGLLWDGEWQDVAGSGRVYGKMNLHNALDGETVVSVSGVPLSRERSELSADGRLGVSYEWNEGYAVRGEVMASQRDDAEEIRADFAMSIDF